METSLQKAIKAIEGQQGKERTPVWMVGEQLKDILRHEPEKAELVWQDLVHGGMKLTDCERKIKALADNNRRGNFACVTPAEAEEIIREYFGIGRDEGDPSGASRQPCPALPLSAAPTSPSTGGSLPSTEGRHTEGGKKKKIIDLEDFF